MKNLTNSEILEKLENGSGAKYAHLYNDCHVYTETGTISGRSVSVSYLLDCDDINQELDALDWAGLLYEIIDDDTGDVIWTD